MASPPLIIRERRVDERDLFVAIHRSAYHPDTLRPNTDKWEEMQDEGGAVLRLMGFLGDRSVACASIAAMPFLPEGACIVTLAVHPEARRQGIATAMFAKLLEFARLHALTKVQCTIHEADIPRVETWLRRETFVEWNRTRLSKLRLDSLDAKVLKFAENRVLEQGMTITTMAAEDSEPNRHKLWQLFVATHRDVPWGPAAPDMPYDKFARRFAPPFLVDCTTIVRDHDVFAGFTQPMHEAFGVASTAMTGVLAEYRNRGVAFAAKARCAALLRTRGYTEMRTMNHVRNASMLALNAKMGYSAQSELLFFEKILAPPNGE